MNVQVLTNINTQSFIKEGNVRIKNGIFKQDAGRSGALVAFTLLAWDSASLKWVVFEDETAVDGTQTPKGISFRALTEAQIIAGDTPDFTVYYLGEPGVFDEDQLTIENSLTMDTVVTSPTGQNQTVRQHLEDIGLIGNTVVDVTSFENA